MTSSSTQPITQGLLARAHSPDSASRIFTEKIQYRPLLLRPSSPPPTNARDARRKARQAEKQKSKQKPKPLSARERRRLGLYDVPRDQAKYALFEPLHDLWLGYIREVLGNDIHRGGPETAQKLTSAEFHGAEVEVSRSGCVSRVGVKGIVIKDTRFVFEIITRRNKIKTVPKEGTMFRVVVPVEKRRAEGGEGEGEGADGKTAGEGAGTEDFIFEIHGDQFLYRAADRASKKFKAHNLKNL
ncbi:related to ribonuclease P protein subunit p29 [Cephalotrichum gorgonifer]|uniref:Ribonuclease P protein subunit n=1 Tax=Cephalotrichum gorgonifer TaxID=2041049 RepID=A0AAE8N1S2_9PEZI|nr:related to ribonuclease P protein subunit p29 [Cephalotrichum gorgonifer]